MKKQFIRGIIFGFALLAVLNTACQHRITAESILDRYIEVTGGREAYESRTSEVAHGKMEIATVGISGTLTSYAKPGCMYLDMNIAGIGQIEQGVKDGIAWENSILQGARIQTGDEREMTLRDSTFNAPIHWREIYPTVEMVGIESINGEDAYRILQTPTTGNPVTTYYSVKTGLAIKATTTIASQMGNIPAETTMLEYKDFGGVLTPTKLIQKAVGQDATITVDSVEVNVDIPDERFNLPEAVQALVK